MAMAIGIAVNQRKPTRKGEIKRYPVRASRVLRPRRPGNLLKTTDIKHLLLAR